jgi:hypothetical protein
MHASADLFVASHESRSFRTSADTARRVILDRSLPLAYQMKFSQRLKPSILIATCIPFHRNHFTKAHWAACQEPDLALDSRHAGTE